MFQKIHRISRLTILIGVAVLAASIEIGLTYWESYDIAETRFSLMNFLAITIGLLIVFTIGRRLADHIEKISHRISSTRVGLRLTRGRSRDQKLISGVIAFVIGCMLIGALDAIFYPPVGYIVGGVALCWWMFLISVSGEIKR